MFAHAIADNLYHQARNRGHWGQVWSLLTARSHRLLTLARLDLSNSIYTRSEAGLQTVPINRIRGSESRGREFDRYFNPLAGCDRERWLRVARAWQAGLSLPPIELIQVGEVYFVRDGHHRISVARALGQQDIEARIIAWQVKGSLPWEDSTTGPDGARTRRPVKRLVESVEAGYHSLKTRALLSLGYLLIVVGRKLTAQGVPK